MHVNAGLRDWIICTAAGCLIFVTGAIVPVLTIPAMLLYQCPALLMSHIRGPWRSMSCGMAVSMLLSLLLPPTFAAICLLAFWAPGALTGWLSNRVKGRSDILLAGIVISLAFKVMAALAAWRLTGLNFLAPDAAEMERYIIAFSGSGLSTLTGGDALKFREIMTETVNSAIMLIPYTMILFSAAEVMACCSLSSYIERRRGNEPFFSLPPFWNWSFPRNILFAFVVGIVCDLISRSRPDLYIVKQVGANLNVATRTLFIVQGLSVSYYILGQRGVPRFLRITLAALTPLVPILGHMCMLVGIFDMGFDLRKRVRGKPQ
ncbi:MAG: YybS family protein [Synergistaceae bacterium]|jgi:uncharacterized protein YybS (DUF2232 family)|nr:YybS family protein [Synergistaceae bacterium]